MNNVAIIIIFALHVFDFQKPKIFIAKINWENVCFWTDIIMNVCILCLGETPAAMQHGGSNRCGRLHSLWVIITFAWILFRLS